MGSRIKDVAKEANVSIATVSRVINNVPLVNEETKQRVLDAIQKTGYKPNAIARSLKLHKTNTIGVLIYDITRPYYTLAARGIEDTARENGYNIILCNTDSDPDKELRGIEVFVQKQCDGVIFLGKNLDIQLYTKFLEESLEVVLGAVEDETGILPGVFIDNEQAAFDMTEYIISCNHKEIGLINVNPETAYFAKKREEGFLAALKKHGLKTKAAWMQTGDFTYEGGSTAMQKLLDSGSYPTAIFCMNDEMALGAIRCVEKNGLKVPEDISIAGFNNFNIAEWTNPSITSVDHDMYDLGVKCAQMLIRKINKEMDKPENQIISHQIIKRNSVIKK